MFESGEKSYFWSHSSELEGKSSHFHVLCLAEFVLESCQELRVHFNNKTADIFGHNLEIALQHACEGLHFFVPRVGRFLETAAGQHKTGGCHFGWPVLE